MATKRIIKFALKMAVAGLILVGVIFVIKKVTSPKTSQNDIVNATNKYEIGTTYKQSYDEALDYAQVNTAQYIRISNANLINDALFENYNYYLNLTLFENKTDTSLKNKVVSKIKTLSNQVKETTDFENMLKTQGLETDELAKRLHNYANNYFEQTKTFLELNDLLKEYVYKVNYKSQITGNIYETQLEMIRDYSKTVFEEDIYQKFSEPNKTILTNQDATSFKKVMEKFNARQPHNTNGGLEVKFAERYMTISKTDLYEFYKHTSDKQEYINSIQDSTTKSNLTYLLQYLGQVLC